MFQNNLAKKLLLNEQKFLNLNFIITFLYCTIVCFFLLNQFNLFYIFSDFVFDLIIVSFIALFLYAYGLKKTSKVFFISAVLIINFQLIVFKITGMYLNDLELDNIQEFDSISLRLLIKSLCWFLIFTGGSSVIILIFREKLIPIAKKYFLLGMLLFIAFLSCNLFALTRLPSSQLIEKLSNRVLIDSWTIDETKKAEQRKIYHKNWIYKEDHQFVPDLSGKNIIVFFIEGLSSKIIDKYHKIDGLTPNLTKMINNSVYFDNYFNHTTPTYRGLVGQLTSTYVMPGSNFFFSNDLISVPQILHQYGYNSYFLSSHGFGHPLNKRMKQLQFDRVFYGNYSNDKSYAPATDKEVFQTLNYLIENNNLKEPYFLGIYTQGTHLGLDSPDLIFADGKNSILNIYHNLDYFFGLFMQKLMSSDQANNFAIILTADHATMYSPEIENLLGYTDMYISKIPLAIYYKGITPKILDAQGKNSLNIAPTILQMLRIKKADNFFLGCSLFDYGCETEFMNVSAIGKKFYNTKSNKVELMTEDNPIGKKILDFYNLSAAEEDNTKKQ